MSARNDITGDPIKTKANNQAYRDQWERIYGTKSNHNLATSQTNDTSSSKPHRNNP